MKTKFDTCYEFVSSALFVLTFVWLSQSLNWCNLKRILDNFPKKHELTSQKVCSPSQYPPLFVSGTCTMYSSAISCYSPFAVLKQFFFEESAYFQISWILYCLPQPPTIIPCSSPNCCRNLSPVDFVFCHQIS
jgi:hypothetical protein